MRKEKYSRQIRLSSFVNADDTFTLVTSCLIQSTKNGHKNGDKTVCGSQHIKVDPVT